MVEWIQVDTPKITKIGYNAEIKIMYIDFYGSITDIPYKDIPEDTFQEFSHAAKVDEYYEKHIKTNFERVDIDTENTIMCGLDNKNTL